MISIFNISVLCYSAILIYLDIKYPVNGLIYVVYYAMLYVYMYMGRVTEKSGIWHYLYTSLLENIFVCCCQHSQKVLYDNFRCQESPVEGFSSLSLTLVSSLSVCLSLSPSPCLTISLSQPLSSSNTAAFCLLNLLCLVFWLQITPVVTCSTAPFVSL